ncbi:MAG TPA: universal stress protein, partial [Planctomycetota bacterium]|nr:universal stress protein [Planctomycetota bacterium]
AYETFRSGGVTVDPLMKMGDPAREILEVCQAEKADLIAMTTHARVGPTRWMMGSVTEKVLRSSSVPLLVVRPRTSGANLTATSRALQGTSV